VWNPNALAKLCLNKLTEQVSLDIFARRFLKGFCEDHALYMQAWSKIERARYHHGRQEYGLAKQHFEKAAQLHKSLKRWSYLEPNCGSNKLTWKCCSVEPEQRIAPFSQSMDPCVLQALA
jgi:hypothetical protein